MNILLTFDYELFGDGSGDIINHLVRPMYNILKACDKHNIKITIFFEAIEYIKLKDEWNKGNRMGYEKNPIREINKQVRHAVNNGHDVQLHIHPQWKNAKYYNNKWNLDYTNWRLGDFNIPDNNYSIKNLLQDGITEINNIIMPINNKYKCIALRAGGYNIMPSNNVYNAMVDVGLKVDSSVFPGGYEEGCLSRYDYRDVTLDKDYWWASDEDIRLPSLSKSDIVEIPIFSLPIYRWEKIINYNRIRMIINNINRSISSVTRNKVQKLSLAGKIKYLFKKEATTWDVCLFSKATNLKYFRYIESKLINYRDSVVLIGHPKSMVHVNLINSFIELTKCRDLLYSFKTITDNYCEIENKSQ